LQTLQRASFTGNQSAGKVRYVLCHQRQITTNKVHRESKGNKMRKSLHLTTEFMPRAWPIFAVGFVGGGNEFVLHLYLICFRIRWGY